MSDVTITVNGREMKGAVEDRTLLVTFLRENLGLTGTHVGCDTSQCGACVVHVDGKAVKSCTMLAVQASGASVTTIEGLADGAELWRDAQDDSDVLTGEADRRDAAQPPEASSTRSRSGQPTEVATGWAMSTITTRSELTTFSAVARR